MSVERDAFRDSGTAVRGAPAGHGQEPAAPGQRVPTVILDDLHVVYRVYAAGGKGTAASALMRTLRRQRRPGIREVHAIRGISLVAYEGETIGVVGRNGAGKSTLLAAIAGLLPPDAGDVYARGQPSLLGVNAALMNDLTGDRNIVLGCLAMGMSPKEVKAVYGGIVEFSGLGDFVNLPMRTYSTGMAQRLRFAIASARDHDVLLIDEALATGDAEFRRRSEKRLAELREQAATVFLVSHSLDPVTEICDRAIWLERGQLRMDADPATVVAAYRAASAGGGQ